MEIDKLAITHFHYSVLEITMSSNVMKLVMLMFAVRAALTSYDRLQALSKLTDFPSTTSRTSSLM